MTAMPSTQALFDIPNPVVTRAPVSSRTIVKSGGATQCMNCAMRKVCLPQACGSADEARLENVVQHSKPVLHRRETLYRQGDRFDALYVVRAGSIKTFMISENGEEHITGFYLPGDIVGVDAVSSGKYPTSAVALETTSVCTLPFSALEKLAAYVPNVQRYVFQMMAREIQRDQNMMLLLSRKNAEQRVATLLLRVSEHLQQRKLFGEAFRLSMSRTDIGNYLGLAVETVCRVMTRFQKLNLVRAEGREIALLDSEALLALANATVEMH